MILPSISRSTWRPALHTLSKRFVTESQYVTFQLKCQLPGHQWRSLNVSNSRNEYGTYTFSSLLLVFVLQFPSKLRFIVFHPENTTLQISLSWTPSRTGWCWDHLCPVLRPRQVWGGCSSSQWTSFVHSSEVSGWAHTQPDSSPHRLVTQHHRPQFQGNPGPWTCLLVPRSDFFVHFFFFLFILTWWLGMTSKRSGTCLYLCHQLLTASQERTAWSSTFMVALLSLLLCYRR